MFALISGGQLFAQETRTYYLSDSQWSHLVAGEVRLHDRTSQESGGNLYDPMFAANFMGARLSNAGLEIANVDLPTPYAMEVEAEAAAHEKLAGLLEFFNQSIGGVLVHTKVFAIPMELMEDERLAMAGGESPFAKVLASEGEVEQLIRTLSSIGEIDLLSAPAVVTRSAQRAKVEVVRELLFPSDFEPPKIPEKGEEADSAVLPSQPSGFESRNIGLTCNFVPRLELDGFINLDMAIEDNRFLGFVNYGNPISVTAKGRILGRPKAVQVTENRMDMPVFNLRRFEGSVRVRPGDSVIVGGMAHEEVTEVEGGRQFPLIGKRRTWMDSTKTALFFVVTASLVDNAGKTVLANQ